MGRYHILVEDARMYMSTPSFHSVNPNVTRLPVQFAQIILPALMAVFNIPSSFEEHLAVKRQALDDMFASFILAENYDEWVDVAFNYASQVELVDY
eukprot:6191682-Pleurochrysis_carterae.AAC.1